MFNRGHRGIGGYSVPGMAPMPGVPAAGPGGFQKTETFGNPGGGIGGALRGAGGWIKDNPELSLGIAGGLAGLYAAHQSGKVDKRRAALDERNVGLNERQVDLSEEDMRRGWEREERRERARAEAIQRIMQRRSGRTI